uniref:Uncharacterized protein n=1 Tax=Cacopsylla melanoneura TaxID=428564 RepID=A0A8D8UTH0_9HEMI
MKSAGQSYFLYPCMSRIYARRGGQSVKCILSVHFNYLYLHFFILNIRSSSMSLIINLSQKFCTYCFKVSCCSKWSVLLKMEKNPRFIEIKSVLFQDTKC